MALFHLNLATGNVIECPTSRECKLGLPRKEHYSSREEASAAREAALSIAHSSARLVPTDAQFDEALSRAVQGGFVRASRDYPENHQAQLDILFTQTGIKHLADELCIASGSSKKEKLARTLAWIVRESALADDLEERRAYSVYVEGYLRTRDAQDRVLAALRSPQYSADEVLGVAASMWLYRHSRFHQLAKTLLFEPPHLVTGYTPKTESTVLELSNSKALETLSIDPESLPADALAFDVETDTAGGFGLRPTRTQITEIVVSARETSWVFSGDEAFILEKFAELLNSQDGVASLVGWNNRCFDNIALQTRAEYHETPGWNSTLLPADNLSVFEPAGPTPEAQALRWVTPKGNTLEDIDVFQKKVSLDRTRGERYSPGLKRFVESFGVHPVKVDRHRLHELSDSDRQDYVLSDGLSTLAAWGAVREDLLLSA